MLADTARPTFDQRALAGTPITIGFGYLDAEGSPAAAPETPTVAVTNLAGDTVTAGAVTTVDGSGDRPDVFTSTIAATAVGNDPDVLTAVWTVAGATFSRTIGVVGRHLFNLADVRRRFPKRSSWSDDEIRHGRAIVESEAARVLRGRAMTPHARTVTMPIPAGGYDKLIVPDSDLRAIRAVSISERGGAGVAYTADERAELWPNRAGIIARVGSSSWPSAPGTVTLTYEYGLDGPPEEVQQAALRRLEFWLTEPTSILPSFSTGYTVPETGAQHRFSSNMDTGDMLVDRIYKEHARRVVPIA